MLPSVAGVVIFVLLPFLDVVRRSFVTAVTQEWIGFRNYKIIFSNQAFWAGSEKYSAFYTGLSSASDRDRVVSVRAAEPLKRDAADQIPVSVSHGHACSDGGAHLEDDVLQTGIFKRMAYGSRIPWRWGAS